MPALLPLRRLTPAISVVATLGAAAGQSWDESTPEQGSLVALGRATELMRSISTNGGWVGIYSLDLETRYGEATYEPAGENEIWVQPPGTPTIGGTFLRAYRVTRRGVYLDAARDAGRALAWGQRAAGGWGHRVDVSVLTPDAERPERAEGHGTFDDDISQSAIRFLMDLDVELDEPWLDEAVELGLRFLLDAQFENGAWPQCYPLRGGYYDLYTFNDRAINDCIRTLLDAYDRYGRDELLAAATLGGEFVVSSQLSGPQAGWAQQYSHDGKPAPARMFEPVAVCSAVTSRNLGTLLTLHRRTGDDRWLEPFSAAAAWSESARLDDGRWARFYELDSDRPIFADRDGSVHYSLDEISEERRSGYSWLGGYGVESVLATWRSLDTRVAPRVDVTDRYERSAVAARRWISRLDDQGRWVRDGAIHVADFVSRANALLDHVEACDAHAASLRAALASPKDLPARPELPDPLVLEDGTKIEDAASWWTKRRPEVLALVEHYVYGHVPGRPAGMRFELLEEGEAFDGAATRKQIRVHLGVGDSPSFDLLLYAPTSGAGPAPCFLGLNFYGNHSVTDDAAVPLSTRWSPSRADGVVDHRATEESRGTSAERWSIEQTVARGYAVATVYHGDLDPDFDDGFANGVHTLLYRQGQSRPEPGDWGTIAAWAWGLSRALDCLEQEPLVDASRVAVMGHSRNGKTALFAGATDPRFALTISNQSGCGGAALSRRRMGEKVARINDVFPHWFTPTFHAFGDREDHLPLDQHFVVSLVAPRPVLVCSAQEDLWADPEGEFLAAKGAEPVYELLGATGLGVDAMPGTDELVGGTLAYHVRPGEHAVGPADWALFCDFADRFLRDD